MSAIAGLIDWQGGVVREPIEAALAALEPHGSDSAGLWVDASSALGWRQTILDEEDYNDKQPLVGASGVRVVFDGRIDNRGDLAHQLGLETDARSWPDSAFVVAAFEKWGTECTHKLIGDYSFAAWNAATRRLVLARDHMGHRPLFFHRGAGFFMFASTPSALFANPRVPMDLDDGNFVMDLAFTLTGTSETIYRNIECVPPGHAITLCAGSMNIYRHWRPETIPELNYARDEDYVDAFREILQESVVCRLRTIHPIGSHLSSGWDSSTVTSIAASFLAGRGQCLQSFTAVPPARWRPDYDDTSSPTNEAPLAAAVAARLPNVKHVLSHWPQVLDFRVLDRDYDAFERPRKTVSLVGWLDQLHVDARQRGIRVMLAGGCGNRTISCTGLETLSFLFHNNQIPALIREWLALGKAGYSLALRAQSSFGPYLHERVWSALRWLYGVQHPSDEMRLGINGELLSEARLFQAIRNHGILHENNRRMDYRIYRKLCTSSLDLASTWGGGLAAYDLQIRDPTADRRLMSFRAAVPDTQFLHRGTTNWLLRRTMDNRLPPDLMCQTGRAQQAADWFLSATNAKKDIEEEVERSVAIPRLSDLVDWTFFRKLVENWPTTITTRQNTLDYRRLLVTVSYLRFARRFLEVATKRG